MAVNLRLARFGVRRRPFYRIVAAEKGSKREGKFIERLGSYDPIANPPKIVLKEDRIKHWVGVGAQTTGIVRNIIKKSLPGLLEGREKAQLKKLQANRKKRKERIAKRGSKK